MSSILTTKTLGIVAGIAGVSAVGGGIAYGTGLFSDSKPEQKEIVLTNNRKKLTDEGFEVLSAKGNDQEWGKIFSVYSKAQKGTFKEGVGADATRKKEELINECQRQLALDTDESYKLTRQWCVKEQSVTEILKKGYKQLDTTQEKPDEKATWTEKLNALKATQGNKFKDLRDKVTQPNKNETTLRTECKNLSPNDIKTTNEKFEDVFEKTREFCSKKK